MPVINLKMVKDGEVRIAHTPHEGARLYAEGWRHEAEFVEPVEREIAEREAQND